MSSASIFVFWRINSLIASKTANSDRMDSRHIANSQRIEMPWYSILGSWRSDVQLRFFLRLAKAQTIHICRGENFFSSNTILVLGGAISCHIQRIPQLRSIAQLPPSSQGGRFSIRVPAAERQCIWKYSEVLYAAAEFPAALCTKGRLFCL